MQPKRAAPPQDSPTLPLVLIIDDDYDAREMYSEYFRYVGFRVITASDGETGISFAQSRRPDAIVMDLTMRPLDGWEATRRLKRHRRTAQIPVIACTGNFLGRFVERALEAGCDAYVVKPCLPEDLAREIRRVLDGFARGAQAQA